MDLLLERDSHDLALENYDLQLVTRHNMVVQAIRQNLRFFYGEWFLAVDEGVPYFQEIFKKGTNIVTVEAYLKKAVIETSGVLKLLRFSLDYDQVVRKLIVMFEVNTIFGSVYGEIEP